MIWSRIKKPKLRPGQIREVIKFAWMPVFFNDGQVIWLSKYKEIQIVTLRFKNNDYSKPMLLWEFFDCEIIKK